MKNLKNKIFAGALTLASFGLFGEKNLIAQSADSLYIRIDTINPNKVGQRIHALGFYNNNLVVFFGCWNYKKDNYLSREITKVAEKKVYENFEIDYNNEMIDYKEYSINPLNEIVNFENLTKEQIFQDKKFAERTKRIINACNSEEKLREMVKEIYKENGEIKIPNIKQ